MRTSLATTAKPRPESPARAASTPALRARRFVWKGNLVDDVDDLADLVSRGTDFGHGRNRLANDIAAIGRLGMCVLHDLARQLRAFRRLADLHRKLVERRRRFLERSRLILRPTGQVVSRLGDLA